MIANVAPRKANGAEKSYAIKAGSVGPVLWDEESATPGSFIRLTAMDMATPSVRTSTGVQVPLLEEDTKSVVSQSIARAPVADVYYYFVMPAMDVFVDSD